MAYYNGQQIAGFKANITNVDENELRKMTIANMPYNNKKLNDENNIVGYKGYHMIGYNLSSDSKSVEIELRDAELDEKAIDKYKVGDKVNIEADTHSYKKEQITAIKTNDKGNTVVTLKEIDDSEIGFNLEPEDELENWLYVTDKYVGELIPQFSHAAASGIDTIAAGYAAFAGGRNNKAYGNYGFVIGRNNIASYLGVATGINTKAIGHGSQAHGKWSEAIGEYSVALGDYSKTTGKHSIAVGCMDHRSVRTQANATNTVALGQGTIAGSSEELGKNSIAAGYGSRAYGSSSLAMGYETQTGEQGQGGDVGLNAIAGGNNTKATGKNSVALGSGSEATAFCSMAVGYNSKAYNENSAAFGFGSKTEALNSFAAGYNVNTVKGAPDGQAALGKYNEGKTTTILEVGNGTSSKKANAFAVNQDGTATVQTDPKNAMDVATKQYVDRLEAEIAALKQAIINLGGTI